MFTPRNQGHLIDPCPTPKQHSANSPKPSSGGNALHIGHSNTHNAALHSLHECSRNVFEAKGNFFIMHSLVKLQCTGNICRNRSNQTTFRIFPEENPILHRAQVPRPSGQKSPPRPRKVWKVAFPLLTWRWNPAGIPAAKKPTAYPTKNPETTMDW